MARSREEQRLCEIIGARADALLDDLRLHVGIPTGRNHVAGLDETRERLTARLTSIGADFERCDGDPKPGWLLGGEAGGPIPPTAVCRRTSGRPGPRVLIAGHLDTVHDPDDEFNALSVAPDTKTATGPGCVDMKGGLVVAVHALEALEEAGLDAAWSFFLNSDEETGSFHSHRKLEEESLAHDVGLALEPALAGGALAIERMGSGQFMVECRGRSAHVGREFEKGVSAVTRLGECLVRIGSMPDPERGLILSVGPIEGGVAANAVPDRARAWGNVRFPSPEGAEVIARELDALVTEPDAMPSVRVERTFNRPAKPLVGPTHELALLARAAAEDLGQSLPFEKTGGVCDGNIMQAAGLPTIDTVGVRGGGLHTREEWIELSSLVERCELLAVLIHRIAAGAWTPPTESR
jgi:glutamate carboxypeptidase